MKFLKIESIFNLMGYKVDKAYEYLLKNSELSEEEFFKWKDKKRWEIVNYHFKNNSFYRKKFSSNEIPKNWSELPIMQKSDFQGNIDTFLSKGSNRLNSYFSNTSGSSGHPMSFAKDKFTHSLNWAFWKIRYSELGLDINSLEARFYGISFEPVGNFIDKIKDLLLNRIRYPIYDLSDMQFEKILNDFSSKKIDYIYGYTSAITLFCRYISKKKINLSKICPSLKVVIVTSEVCTNEDRTLIEKTTGVNVFSEYGTSEVGYLTKECRHKNWHILENLVYIESSEKSELIVTDLFNLAQPFIRYKVGDLGDIKSNDCDCKNRGDIIYNFNGRVNDIIYLPSGKVAGGMTFYYISRSILEQSGILKEFIIRQTALDTFVFDIVAFEKLDESKLDIIREKTELYLEKGLKLILNQVEKIDRNNSGKIQHFFSEIDATNFK